jgi:hypothetical protein
MHAAGFAPVLLISASVSAVALGVYDQTVRQPRTPRIAVVDIARLYAAAESQARTRLVAASAQPASPAAAAVPGVGRVDRAGAGQTPAIPPAMPPELATMREMSHFGPRLEGVLRDISTECRCVIAAMAAVVGEVSSVPDYTAVAAGRLGVPLPVAAGSSLLAPTAR